MDIDLLSKIVKEIVLDNDSVTLPGIGSFLAEIVPSSFSDKGYTINPPYRRLYFTRKEGSDTLLVDFYASSNSVSRDDATRIVVTFLSEMKEVLKEKKTVHFPGLGRLRATKENNFFFIPDEDLDIYPAGFGLAPISLKTHEETEDEVSAAVADLASAFGETLPSSDAVVQEEQASETREAGNTTLNGAGTAQNIKMEPSVDEEGVDSIPVSQQAPAPQQTQQTQTAQTQPQKMSAAVGTPVMTSQEALEDIDRKELRQARKGWKRHRKTSITKVILLVLCILLLLLAIYAILARLDPAFVDRFLYNEEELEIIKLMKL